MARRGICAILVSLSLSACATTSFAPPSVNLENETAVRGSNYSIGQRCQPYERKTDGETIPITRDATGARRLIDNFIFMYRCRAHAAANGRQMFEVPALLTGIGTATAAAFGAGPDVAIAGGAATALFSAGKSYYDPKTKAEIFDSSLDALLCIKAVAAGVDPITLGQVASLQEQNGLTTRSGGDGVRISSDEQYYELVAASLLSVERVLAQRLRTVGTFDPAGVIAEIEKLKEQKEEKQAGAEKIAPSQAALLTNDAATKQVVADTIIKLETLQPKLQECVVHAKI